MIDLFDIHPVADWEAMRKEIATEVEVLYTVLTHRKADVPGLTSLIKQRSVASGISFHQIQVGW